MHDRTKLAGLIWNRRLFDWIDAKKNRNEDERPDADDVAEYVDSLSDEAVQDLLSRLREPDPAFIRDWNP